MTKPEHIETATLMNGWRLLLAVAISPAVFLLGVLGTAYFQHDFPVFGWTPSDPLTLLFLCPAFLAIVCIAFACRSRAMLIAASLAVVVIPNPAQVQVHSVRNASKPDAPELDILLFGIFIAILSCIGIALIMQKSANYRSYFTPKTAMWTMCAIIALAVVAYALAG